MSYDQTVRASSGDDAFSGIAVTVEGSSWSGGIRPSASVVSSVGAIDTKDVGRSGCGRSRSPRCCWIWWRIVICWSWWTRISAIYWKRVECVVVSVWKVCTRAWNSEANMVMDDSDVVGATGGTLGVVGGAAKVASSVSTAGVASVGSSPCSGCGGTSGATMGGAPRYAE